MLSENLYKLRKKRGLSQERLAEELNVSRQSISKWESGSAMPESEKLIAIAEYFGTTLDLLVNGDFCEAPDAPPPFSKKASQNPERAVFIIGLSACILGFLSLIVWGIIMLANPAVRDSVAGSSVITVDGSVIFSVLSLAAILFGAIMLLRILRRK